MSIIGVDIGGTNTDAVLINDQGMILKAIKTNTTQDISEGFLEALGNIVGRSPGFPGKIKEVIAGTTQATNAVLQGEDLYRVGVLRIAGQNPADLPPACAWPAKLKASIIVGCKTISGGFQCNGEAITKFRPEEAREAIHQLIEMGAESIAIVGAFSPLNPCQEIEASQIITEIAGKTVPFTMSSKVGGLGFIERENSAILNSALIKVMDKGFKALEKVMRAMGLQCPLMITQNDGSLISLAQALEYPLLTISSGPTNSFIGAARLSGIDDAVIVDIGGTSSDAGIIRNGYPVRSLNRSTIGGISLNFTMPDVHSIALGGGSVVKFQDEKPILGPLSVARQLTKASFAFGGRVLTLTDAAIAYGAIHIEAADKRSVPLKEHQAKTIVDNFKLRIAELAQTMRGISNELPVVLVGGGAAMASFNDSKFLLPRHYDVANAYGAALSEVAGTVDKVISLTSRDSALESLHDEARKNAINNGACSENLKLVDEQIIPYSYVPNNMARVIVRYSGKKSRKPALEQ